MSKRGTAPCGHPGTYVTANFITCDYRCEFDSPKAVTANPRREPGHVDMCACAPCQIRRRSEWLVLTGKCGTRALLVWDGVANRVDWVPGIDFEVRHYSFRDANNDEVASGEIWADLKAGHQAHIDIELFMDAVDKVRLSVLQVPVSYMPYVGTFELEPPIVLPSVEALTAELLDFVERVSEEEPGPFMQSLVKMVAESLHQAQALLEQSLVVR